MHACMYEYLTHSLFLPRLLQLLQLLGTNTWLRLQGRHLESGYHGTRTCQGICSLRQVSTHESIDINDTGRATLIG
jgi:hypothetical protein